MRECPNQKCQNNVIEISVFEATSRSVDSYFAFCPACGTAAAHADSREEAIAAWDALPRVADVATLRRWTAEDGTPLDGTYLTLGMDGEPNAVFIRDEMYYCCGRYGLASNVYEHETPEFYGPVKFEAAPDATGDGTGGAA